MIRRCLSSTMLILSLVLPVWPSQGQKSDGHGQELESEASCGPGLSEHALMGIVRRAILVTGGDPTNLEQDYRVTIRQSGCDYIVVGIRLPETIAQEFAITIDRDGKVKSWPWCCVPEFEIPPPAQPLHGATDPPIVITDAAGRSWPIDGGGSPTRCSPVLLELKEPVVVSSRAWTISFRLVAAGCSEDLGRKWPPSLNQIEQVFTAELREQMPDETLSMIRDGSPELRSRLAKKLNDVLSGAQAHDVFLFDGKFGKR